MGIALICWCLGGLAGVGLSSLSPEFYRSTSLKVPEPFAEMLRYAWVGGSIWGLQLGGLVAVILGIVISRADWKLRPVAAHNRIVTTTATS